MITVDELEEITEGDVLRPGADGWAAALHGHNTAVRHSPAAVLAAASVADIAAGVAFAGRHDLAVSVQATGHGPAVLLDGGLLIRTDRLTGIAVDPDARTVRVQPGVRWGELMTACAAHGLAPLGMASVASVGVVGYTIGGGMGPFGRAQGFAADHVVAVELVTPDGSVRAVDAEHEPDLFWAVRGGRVGFGVITGMTFELADVPAVSATTLTYARPLAGDALAAYASWQAELSEQTTTVATLFRFPDIPELPAPLRGQRLLQIDIVHLGADVPASVDRLVAAAEPTRRTNAALDPAGWLHAQPQVPPGPSWQRGLVLDRLDADRVRRLLAAAGLETDAPWQVVEIRPLGGAFARPAAVPNSVGGRSDGVLVNTVAAGDPAKFAALPAHTALAARLGDAVQREVPINFFGPPDASRPLANAWPADVHARLEAIRQDVDPQRRFSSGGTFPAASAPR